MSALTVVATVVAKKEQVENVKGELLKLVGPTRNEAGCVAYLLHQDNDNPAVFVFYETWEDLACLEAHMKTNHFRDYVAAVDGLLENKTVYKMTRVA